VKGKPFIIAKAGKPLVKVLPVEAPASPHPFGFLEGQFNIPDDFDTFLQDEITALFEGRDEAPR
jgi:antitoxin (DNA-binding transcriptional repressor) of toxin-antitoxin stability system